MSARSQARLENIAKRALYALNAGKRVADSVLSGKSVRSAIDVEKSNFRAHQRVAKARLKAAALNDKLIAIYGPVLGWHHGPLTPTDRPHHVAAHGKNYNPLESPIETEGLPGTLPNCKCKPGAPFPNAPVLR